MSGKVKIAVPKEQIAEFCRRHHIRKLALFGSVLRDDFRPDSDVDVSVTQKSLGLKSLVSVTAWFMAMTPLISISCGRS